ncbi:MAG: AmmeMemoRadiSam system radical SAM enzyme [Candidatus Omnitrophica bacterium]|nr:AmmeMemoRadiSam system radical SAM enzyme [Candidatus Omnitrophota bacterium]MBU4478810.1 AmmeMemoRadiSam system radical SAM enzyme [Candidatus Omnitrophota bacterium]MCG2702881.1 AmmeMemoRadiSam system radical SAM enzyme [Candidatus Omnitrophota bacterium]
MRGNNSCYLKRRDFLKSCLAGSGYLFLNGLPALCAETQKKEAYYYQQLSKQSVQCLNCPHQCVIEKGKRGFCRIKENQAGTLYNIVYGQPCAVHIDPIEKKPFFHVLPGSKSFSLATVGCNLRCKFCQNWQISQATPEQVKAVTMSPEEAAVRAKQSKCLSVAYTYTEPTVFYEYTFDTAQQTKKAGLINVMHTNGYNNPQPLRSLCEYFSAINVDLKGFTEKYYSDICGASLKYVLESLIIIKKEKGVWLELTNLVIPTLNDNPDDIKKMCIWIHDTLGEEVPLHFSRFFPVYQLAAMPPTPVTTLERARSIAMDTGLKYVYIGNIPGHPAENTYCPKCGKTLIKRSGYIILGNELRDGSCGYCREPIAGVWT